MIVRPSRRQGNVTGSCCQGLAAAAQCRTMASAPASMTITATTSQDDPLPIHMVSRSASWRYSAASRLVDDRAIDDALQLAAEVEGARGHQLGHEDDAQVLLRVDPEDRRGGAAPVVVAGAERAGLHLVHGGG